MKSFFYRLLIVIVLSSLSFSREIIPAFILYSRGLVSDFVIDDAHLYVANDEGSVEIFDIVTQKKVNEIFIKPNRTLKKESVPAKILTVDRYKGKTLIVSAGENGYRNVWIHDGKVLKQIISIDKKISVKEARFIDEENFVFATLGYDVIGYTLSDNYSTFREHIEESSFSDMVMSEDKQNFVTASESGQVMKIESKSGKVLNKFPILNLDNIYKLAYKNGTVLTAGQDRKVGVYSKYKEPYFIKSDFLVYAVGLSPSGKIGVYSSNEEGDFQVFDVKTGKKTDLLKGQKSIPSTIKFFNEDGFFSAGYGDKIYYWHLKEF